ncbi:hypothetical protein A1Q1_06779 [Trichosporon asahii var. asahii CBS 2479]|uniref:Transcriptional coactivator p15 (PC4) C-terminal domain-containing protein n=1 Tax=Trichosporon asahii var. asahii (strain ATCC 90039 / CBS 2479 / JCM 2466 / KCTC 7840 / NBRC 103889/ NCYC 2677 / UAMH 7654) TaxID=1186058 RepID=J5RD09_TRIAS|nr:hypothetical protein A1Q1_06779 [Trichosporon asahii var. asahii CBS 2479]EJT51973.1 hypothetical protein A1Q1_06779 [Trichosporon asahii var. asahii CBS 2479]
MPKRKLDSDTVSPSRRSSINNKAAEADDGDDSLPGSERKGHTSAAAKGGVEVELPPDVEYFPNVGASARRSTRSPQFLRDDGAYDELAALETYHPTLKVYGKTLTQSRSIAAYATHPMELKYSGAEIDVHVPFPPVVERVCEKVEEKLGEKFNHVLLNRRLQADLSYDDGSVYIGRHSDTAENKVIAAVSLGSPRTLVFTPRPPPRSVMGTLSTEEKRELNGRRSVKLRLESGSLLVMRPPTQDYWKTQWHSLSGGEGNEGPGMRRAAAKRHHANSLLGKIMMDVPAGLGGPEPKYTIIFGHATCSWQTRLTNLSSPPLSQCGAPGRDAFVFVMSEKPSSHPSSPFTIAMPPRSAEDSASNDDKKPRTSASSEDVPDPTKVQENAEGDEYVSLSKTRRVTVRDFKGKTYVDLRDHYVDKNSGEMKPTGKGIMLTLEQWDALKAAMGAVDGMLHDQKNRK